jgi:hypothetical protein
LPLRMLNKVVLPEFGGPTKVISGTCRSEFVFIST